MSVDTPNGYFGVRRPGFLEKNLTPTYLAILLSYSILISVCTGTAWWTMLVFYESFMVSLWLWHYQAHNRMWWVPFNAGCRAYHKTHHYVDFPSNQFFGTETFLKKDTKTVSWAGSMPLASGIAHEFLLYFLLTMILSVAYWGIGVSVGTLISALVLAGITGVLGNYLHMSFHDPKHWLATDTGKLGEVWRELRVVHYVHHCGGANHNYSMANFFLDWLLGTYKEGIRP